MRHRGRTLQRFAHPPVPLTLGVPGQREGVKNAPVGLSVLGHEFGGPAAELVSGCGQVFGVGQLRHREPRGHGDQPGGQGRGHGGGTAATRRGRPGGNLVQELPYRLIQERGQDKPTTWPSSSRSMRAAAGFLLSPGMVRMSPQMG